MKDRRYRVSMTKRELDVITFCLFFIRKDIVEEKYNDLFGDPMVAGSRGAYHTLNDVAQRAHEDIYGKESRT